MNDQRLRLDLADLAAEVDPVDLRDRTLRASRRLGIQRAVATSAAALLLIGAATGVAFVIRPDASGPAPLPADTPSVTVAPTPTGSPSGLPPTVSPGTSEGSNDSAAKELTGTLYYLGRTSTDAVVHAVQGGADRTVARVPLGGEPCVGNSITVSPNGQRLAWVEDADAAGFGALMIAAIDGTHKRKLAAEVGCLGSTALVWMGSDRLVFRQTDGASVLMNVVSAKRVDGDRGQETDRCWSADGRYLAAQDASGPFVSGPGSRRLYNYEPPSEDADKYDGWSARSVSMDGRFVAVGWKGTDPSRHDDSHAVVEVATSKVKKLPVKGEVKNILFTSDRLVLVRQADRIVVLDAGFGVLDEVVEARDTRGLTLLAYAP
ncbi:hypothetical protein DDE19_03565 [Micromonospora ureilytica]|uniref:WD40 repeat domain-containing protein n=1 Tax=Micromonospora ureilytica TaxID=709868 RepID=A0A3N9Y336_9ACTN|nr:hypothetical protein [Micromonospora ureilytica]RQX19586.1 hypothetical protein DDE19_03565 [Micromonospora ureilytica]